MNIFGYPVVRTDEPTPEIELGAYAPNGDVVRVAQEPEIMSTEHQIPSGTRGLIVSIDSDLSEEEIIRFGAGMEEKLGIPVVVANAPVRVHTVPDLQYGLKCRGAWLVKMDGTIISGTKAEMCALRENRALSMYELGDTVEPLPTE